MEVILLQDVAQLGKNGQIIKVKDGYGRNFLIPNGLAVPSTAANLKKLENTKKQQTLHLEKIKKQAEELKEKLSALSLTMPVLVQEDQTLYASVTSLDIARLLGDEGFQIEKSCIMLEEPLRSLGIFEVPIKLHPEVYAKIKVWIVKK